MSIVATICVELLRAVVNALRIPKLSQGGVYHATAPGEKLLPVITTVALKKSSGGLFGFQLIRPASAEVMTAIGLFTNSGTEFEGAKLGLGFTTATCKTPGTAARLGGIRAVTCVVDVYIVGTGIPLT